MADEEERLLSPDFNVVCAIAILNEKGKPAYFKELCKKFEGEMTKDEISKAIERLIDRNCIVREWKTEDFEGGKKTMMCFSITDEMQPFVTGLVNVTEEVTAPPELK